MQPARKRLTGWFRTSAMILAAFAGGALTAQPGWATGERETPYAPLSQLARVLVFIENQYVDPVERQRILDGAIKGMVAELDPHSAYMTPKEFAAFNEDTEGTFGGIGVEVDFKHERITVLAPIPGGPAAKAGIRAGDEIIAVDDKPLSGLSVDKIVRMMRGAPGTKVKIAARRKGESEPLTFTLVREHVHVNSVEGKRLTGNVAYLRLKQFQSGTRDDLLDVVAAVRKADAADLEGVVLDLRNNPGGLIDEAEAVADEILSSGTIYSTRHRGKILDEVRAHLGGALAKLPLVVIVNEFSASSSELLAAAIQDNQRGSIVGAPTFGKGSVQTIYQLPGAAGLRLTTMRYYTPSGRAIQAAGIQPDIVVRYKDDETKSIGVLREGDLEGALAPESGQPGSNVAEVMVGEKRPELVAIAELPDDPEKSGDFALQVAYRKLRAARAPSR
jgi:carboxyl-terminal processing protease